ncbi:hypothetical protein ONZ45_g4087 [Pleurotus djamor]|nr:hypothetical protein ONZ45_g4087 [Pleurotus djamor]
MSCLSTGSARTRNGVATMRTSGGRAFGFASAKSTGSQASSSPLRRMMGVGFSTGLVMALGFGTVYGDADATGEASALTTTQTVGSLIRSYVVFSMCSVPALVDMSPKLLDILTSIPGIKQITESFVRFVGGDTAQETVPLLKQLRTANTGALFAYSVEVDEDEAAGTKKLKKDDVKPPHKQSVDEMIRCIDVAADFEDSVLAGGKQATRGRKTWVAVKMTALLPDAQSLINLSSYIVANRVEPPIPVAFPGNPALSDLDVLYSVPSEAVRRTHSLAHTLSATDIASLRDLHNDLIRICQRARERGVRVIIDAEYSWYQPAIDALTLSLTRRFNKLPENGSSSAPVLPLIYGTYQAYLKRTPAHIKLALLDAKANGYSLGVKLVRGAYHPHEMLAHQSRQSEKQVGKSKQSPSLSISPDSFPPVWETKPETDSCYNECVKTLIGAIQVDMEPVASRMPTSPRSSWTSPSSWLTKFTEPKQVMPNPSSSGTSAKVPTIGVLFGTHNWTSSRLILDELVDRGLAARELTLGDTESIVHLDEDVTERITIGQLYGMSNALTDYLVSRTRSTSPLVIKYVPYGALSEVMPYLSRRAIENKSVLGGGGASEERRRAGRELWKRLFGS